MVYFSIADAPQGEKEEFEEYDSDGDVSMNSSSSSNNNSNNNSNSNNNNNGNGTSTAALYNTTLTLPGIYQNLSPNAPPRVEVLPCIASFNNTMLQLNSIRKPRRLTIVGSDYKEYHLLCKGGEDLRNDQRIQQLFAHMNTIFNQTSSCRSFKNITYGVVPMTASYGVVEWLNNMEPLRDAYTKQIESYRQDEIDYEEKKYGNGGRSKKKKLDRISLSGPLLDAIQKETKSDPWNSATYCKLYDKSRDMTKDFEKIVLEVGKGTTTLLRRRLMRISNSSEGTSHSCVALPVFFRGSSRVLPVFFMCSFIPLYHCTNVPLLTVPPPPPPLNYSCTTLVLLPLLCVVFHSIRRQLVKCIAVNSACGYLLGMGDRHLENFLISNVDGNMAAIDFGMSFGMATFILPVRCSSAVCYLCGCLVLKNCGS